MLSQPGAPRRRGWSSTPALHTLGWTRQQAIDFMLAHTAEIRRRWRRKWIATSSIPGQATAYMLGQAGDQQGARRGAAGDGRSASTSRRSTIACSRTAPCRSASCTRRSRAWACEMMRRWIAACARQRSRSPRRRWRSLRSVREAVRPSADLVRPFDVQEKTIARASGRARLRRGHVAFAGPRATSAASAPTICRDRS